MEIATERSQSVTQNPSLRPSATSPCSNHRPPRTVSLALAAACTVWIGLPSGDADASNAAARKAFLAAGCVGCHTIPGIPGATGRVGPDLSQIGVHAAQRRPGLSAEEYLRESILDPNAFLAPECPAGPCPAGVMLQSFAASLSSQDLDAIVAYLLQLGSTPPQEAAEAETAMKLPDTLPEESRSPLWPGAPARAEADPKRVALGKALFFDTRLSGNRSLACASCHRPEAAFADGLALPRSYPETAYFRNTPSLLDAALRERFFWDGRIDGADLPSLVRDHITEAHFMNADGRLVAERLRQSPAYDQRFREVFGTEPRFGGILDAVASYVATLRSGPTPLDAYRAGETGALDPRQRRGLTLFEGRAGCAECHAGSELRDDRFHDIGLDGTGEALGDPLRAVTFRRFFRSFGTPDYRNLREDPGLFAITKESADRRRFQTPGLRNVARTAPYMHDGSLATLEDVVAHYDAGGRRPTAAGLAALGLSDGEKKDLVAFLRGALASEVPTVREPEVPPYALLPLVIGADHGAGSAQQDPEASPEAGVRTVAATASPAGAETAPSPPPLATLPAPKGPPDNPITEEKRELGRLLFFDARMSGDGSLSCASCHPPGTGWGAPGPLSFGYPGTVHWRNASTVLNTAYYYKLNWDGAAKSIEGQNEGAWTGAVAGNLDPTMAEERLAQIPDYVARFRAVFGTETPRFDDALRAVATYQRTLVSKHVPLDAYLAGDQQALSSEARRGRELFEGKAGCIACHNGPLLSDQRFYALGVPLHPDFTENPLRQITFRWETWIKGSDEKSYQTATEDYGLYFVTKQESDKGKFRTPGLRDICFTGPYMHNGFLETLDDVVRFYDAGGGPHRNKDARIRPLGLEESERADLVAFLEALCGDRIVDEAPPLPAYGTGIAGTETTGTEESR